MCAGALPRHFHAARGAVVEETGAVSTFALKFDRLVVVSWFTGWATSLINMT